MVIYVIDTGTSMRIFVHTYSITCSERISKKLRCFLSIQIAFFFTGFHLGNKFPRIPARLLKRGADCSAPRGYQSVTVSFPCSNLSVWLLSTSSSRTMLEFTSISTSRSSLSGILSESGTTRISCTLDGMIL